MKRTLGLLLSAAVIAGAAGVGVAEHRSDIRDENDRIAERSRQIDQHKALKRAIAQAQKRQTARDELAERIREDSDTTSGG
jgi:hypothetical protein